MQSRLAVALGAALVVVLVGASAHADGLRNRHGLTADRLPPVSGTLRMRSDAFGRSVDYGGGATLAQPGRWNRNVVGGRFVDRRYGYPTAYRVDHRYDRSRFAYGATTRPERWATGGTGLFGLIGNHGNPFAGGGTTWGTADSATTGVGTTRYAAAEPPLRVVYGEPDLWTQSSYGAPPRLGFYGSGQPSTLSYYSSGSSAGPDGSPGGLAVYSSGAYGPGPKVIMLGQQQSANWAGGCNCGPRIIRVGHRHRHSVTQ